jgi:hypothetical protein
MQTRGRMVRWMIKVEVEGHLGIKEIGGTLVFHHPNGDYDVYLKNLDMSSGIEKPMLSIFLIFNAGNIAEADKIWRRYLDRFLEFLSFATGSRFRLNRPVCLFDWSPDESSMRQGYVYQRFSDASIPQLVMGGWRCFDRRGAATIRR